MDNFEILKIVGGAPVMRNSSGHNPFPYHAQLRIYNRTSNSALVCGATVVHAYPRTDAHPAQFWVLTAAHCLYAPRDGSLSFGVRYWVGDRGQPGTVIEQDGPVWRDTRKLLIFRHPLHNDESNMYDVALIRCTVDALPEWMLNFDNIPIMSKSWHEDTSSSPAVTIVGYGSTSNAEGRSAPMLMFTRGQVSNNNIRSFNTTAFVNVFGERDSRACSGDSGGGCFDLSAPVPVVFGPLCCVATDTTQVECLNPSLYSRISQYMDADQRFSKDVVDSPWSKGVKYIIDAYSPTGLRKKPGETQDSADVGEKYDPNQDTGFDDTGTKADKTLWNMLEDLWTTPLVKTIAIILVIAIIILILYRIMSSRRRQSASPRASPRTSRTR